MCLTPSNAISSSARVSFLSSRAQFRHGHVIQELMEETFQVLRKFGSCLISEISWSLKEPWTNLTPGLSLPGLGEGFETSHSCTHTWNSWAFLDSGSNLTKPDETHQCSPWLVATQCKPETHKWMPLTRWESALKQPLTFHQCLLVPRTMLRHFYIKYLIIPHSKLVQKILLVFPFYKWRSWNIGCVGNFPKVTELVNTRARGGSTHSNSKDFTLLITTRFTQTHTYTHIH